MSRSRLGLEAERLGSRLGLGHEGLVSIPDITCLTLPYLTLLLPHTVARTPICAQHEQMIWVWPGRCLPPVLG